ncbi:ATP-binding cassette sub-family C member 4-like [Anabrus simplex]|uniref:ATP-binding cassette sub-family C member 4-like n=1 Tax=Anabrus simplex TaxID=316456 RepID=UPI0035A3963F
MASKVTPRTFTDDLTDTAFAYPTIFLHAEKGIAFSLPPPPPPIASSSFEKLTRRRQRYITWIRKIIWKSYKKGITEDDLFNVSTRNSSKHLGDILEKNWHKELLRAKLGRKPSFLRAVLKTFAAEHILYSSIIILDRIVIRMLQPYFLGKVIQYFAGDKSIADEEAYIYATVLVSLSLLKSMLNNNFTLVIEGQAMRVSAACCSLIYRKVLKHNTFSMNQSEVGKVINLMANDASRFETTVPSIPWLWVTVLQAIVIVYLVWQYMGPSSLFGMAVIIVTSLPTTGAMTKLLSGIRRATAILTDERIKKLNDCLSGIQVIKMYAWEKPFAKLVSQTRKKEINEITKASYIKSYSISSFMFVDKLSVIATLTSYSLLGNLVLPFKVYPVVNLWNLFRFTFCYNFGKSLISIAESMNSINRIEEFLMKDDASITTIQICENKSESFSVGEIAMKNCCASWTNKTYTLEDITLNVQAGSLCSIIGSVASGKSSLLHVLLGELPLTSGTLSKRGSVSYSSQECWIFVGTVRQNILFGQRYDPVRYREVVRVCALERDLKMFPYGDKTLIGERGITLSGGQRARINLARAVYRDADIYILDDPLSAVDSQVGKQIFSSCIKDFLKNKTRILVTHQLQYLHEADYVIVMDDGKIQLQGPPKELMERNNNFTKFLAYNAVEDTRCQEKSKDVAKKQTLAGDDNKEKFSQDKYEEALESSISKWKVYQQYIRAAGNPCILIFWFSLFTFGQVACSATDIWLTHWLSLKASKKLYDNMFRSILSATMRFFDTNPAGRILNRFSKDTYVMDEHLPSTMLYEFQMFFFMIGSIVIIIKSNYYMVLPTLFIGCVFFWVAKTYKIVAGNCKRLESINCLSYRSYIELTGREANEEQLDCQSEKTYMPLAPLSLSSFRELLEPTLPIPNDYCFSVPRSNHTLRKEQFVGKPGTNTHTNVKLQERPEATDSEEPLLLQCPNLSTVASTTAESETPSPLYSTVAMLFSQRCNLITTFPWTQFEGRATAMAAGRHTKSAFLKADTCSPATRGPNRSQTTIAPDTDPADQEIIVIGGVTLTKRYILYMAGIPVTNINSHTDSKANRSLGSQLLVQPIPARTERYITEPVASVLKTGGGVPSGLVAQEAKHKTESTSPPNTAHRLLPNLVVDQTDARKAGPSPTNQSEEAVPRGRKESKKYRTRRMRHFSMSLFRGRRLVEVALRDSIDQCKEAEHVEMNCEHEKSQSDVGITTSILQMFWWTMSSDSNEITNFDYAFEREMVPMLGSDEMCPNNGMTMIHVSDFREADNLTTGRSSNETQNDCPHLEDKRQDSFVPCSVSNYEHLTMALELPEVIDQDSDGAPHSTKTHCSPVYSHVAETINGLTIIQASKAVDIMEENFYHLQDRNNASKLIIQAISNGIGLWLEVFNTLFLLVLVISYFAVGGDSLTGGNVGLALSQSIIISGMFQYVIKQFGEVASQMTSVERILEYTAVESESALESIPDKKPTDVWPERGVIVFSHVFLQYGRKGTPVLKDVSFTVQENHKVGVVGRTGAGKSSLIIALFRLANVEGSILIDNVDTGSIGLHDLRKKIAVIPQEPVLFSATLRYNLDPFDEFPDELLWKALEDVELKGAIESLDWKITDRGSNLSVGQRQLVCLARAILRNSRILVLDEATANMDLETDALIQKTIRRKFQECTVLTIAHRLNTIMDSDKVLVMEGGTVVEYDHPYVLLQNKDSYFSKLVKDTGTGMEEKLCTVAQEAFQRANNSHEISTSESTKL